MIAHAGALKFHNRWDGLVHGPGCDVANSSDFGTAGISKVTSPLLYQALGSRHAIICTRIDNWPQRHADGRSENVGSG